MSREVSGIRVTVDLHKTHPLVTTRGNVAGAATTILTLTPGDNQIVYWPNDLPVVLKLFNTAGVEVAHEAELTLYKIWPGRIQEDLLATQAYSPWRNTPIADQSDPRREPNLTFPFHVAGAMAAKIEPGFRLELRLNAAVIVDWARADTVFFAAVGQDIIS